MGFTQICVGFTSSKRVRIGASYSLKLSSKVSCEDISEFM